jgi:hypothetical protein
MIASNSKIISPIQTCKILKTSSLSFRYKQVGKWFFDNPGFILFRRFFSMHLVKSCHLPPDRNYLFTLHPHGVSCFCVYIFLLRLIVYLVSYLSWSYDLLLSKAKIHPSFLRMTYTHSNFFKSRT